jgi:hypothetical protein
LDHQRIQASLLSGFNDARDLPFLFLGGKAGPAGKIKVVDRGDPSGSEIAGLGA